MNIPTSKHTHGRNLGRIIASGVTAMLVMTAGWTAAADTGNPGAEQSLRASAARLRGSEHRFTALIEQHITPLAVAGNIGRRDERFDLRMEGAVTGPDDMRVRITADGVRAAKPVVIEKIAGRSYAIAQDGTRQPVDDPLAIAPGANFAGMLGGAVNVRHNPSAKAPAGVSVYAFDIDGQTLARHMEQEIHASLAAAGAVKARPSTYQRLSGTGELWVRDADGAPVRQVVDINMPRASSEYDARIRMQVDFSGLTVAPQTWVATGCAQCNWLLNGLLDLTAQLARRMAGMADLLLFVSLGLAFALALAMFGARRSARLRAGVIGLLALNLCLQTPVMVLAQDVMQATRGETQSLGEALGLKPAEQPAGVDMAAIAANTKRLNRATTNDPYINPLVLKCGDGDASLDSDADGLSDKLENCIGTDATDWDFDQDGITDTVEVNGFVLGGNQWPGDPFLPDSNGDGLLDKFEYPAAVGGTAPAPASGNAYDFDSDGIPNVWDDDNDDDGVPDGTDLAPYASGALINQFSLNLARDGSNRLTYIEFQVLPEDLQHLRYANQKLDWPSGDSEGQMRDVDDSADDLTILPMLAIETNVAPGGPLASLYAVSTGTLASGTYQMFIPLSQQSDGGAVRSLYGKIAYEAGSSAINWSSAKLVWWVQAKVDDVHANCSTTCKYGDHTEVIQSYPESFRLAGVSVTASGAFDTLIFGTPSSPNEDAHMFNLMLGSYLTFMQYEKLDGQASEMSILETLNDTLNAPNTTVEDRFGLPLTVTVRAQQEGATHFDAAQAAIARNVQTFLDTHFPTAVTNGRHCRGFDNETYECAALGIATEGVFGSASLNQAQANGSAFNFSLSNVPQQVKRTLKMLNYRHNEDGWRAMELPQVFAMLQQRYRDQLDEIRAAYPGNTVNLTDNDLFVNVFTLYATYHTGQITTILLNGAQLSGKNAPPSTQIAQQIGVLGGGATNMAQIANEITELNSNTNIKGNAKIGLKVFGGVKITLVVANIAVAIANAVCAGKPDLAGCGEKGVAALTITGQFISAVSAASSIADLVVLFKFADDAAEALWENGSKLAKGAAIAGLVIGLVFTWVSFGLTIASANGNPVVVRNAVATAIVTTAYLVFLFVLNFIPGGQIIAGILAVLDFILSAATGGQWSISRILTELFYSAKVMTEVYAVEYAGTDLQTIKAGSTSPEGFVVGNTIRVSNFMSATLRAINNGIAEYGLDDDGTQNDLDDTSIVARYVVSDVTGLVASTASSPARIFATTTITDAPAKIVHQHITATFNATTPQINAMVKLRVTQTFTYVWADCGLWAICAIMHTETVNNPEEDADAETLEDATVTMYWDVFPNSLDNLWNWSELSRTDDDGDGLSNDAEAAAGTTRTNWDSDADGLSDEYEVRNWAAMGTNPTVRDSDGDGLDDGFEVRHGLHAGMQDSDHDTAPDGAELLAVTVTSVESALARGESIRTVNWTGGWDVNLPGGGKARVFGHGFLGDSDREGLIDGQEAANAASPYAINGAPRLSLQTRPWAADPNGVKSGVFVAPGTPVNFTMNLGSYGPGAITGTLSGCFPNLIDGLAGGALQGLRQPAMQQGACTDGTSRSYSFAGANQLQLAEEVSATYSGVMNQPSGPQNTGEVRFVLPYRDMVLTATASVAIDVDDPRVGFSAPMADRPIRGSTYIVGGYASDPTSWVDQLQIRVNGAPISTLLAAHNPMQPFAYAWSLPADGIYSLDAVATDHVGRSTTSTPMAVTVDNTAPTATLNLPSNVVRPTGQPFSITLNGTSSDNLSGIARVQISIDGAPFRTVVENSAVVTSQPFSYVWRVGPRADGAHALRVRAYDRAGNISSVASYSIIIDSLPPTSALLTNRFKTGTPDVKNEALALAGLANDAGRAPLSLQPVPLAGEVNSVLSATVWVQPASMRDDNAGVTPQWLGDINGDGRADLALGFPAARGGAGAVAIVYGKTGGFTREDLQGARNLELLERATSVLVGVPGAGIGSRIAPVGDVNCDGLNDILVGDPLNHRAVIAFGSGSSFGANALLQGNRGSRAELKTAGVNGLGERVAALGDINGDGADDFAVGTATRAYVMLGHCEVWFETQDTARLATYVIDTAPGANIAGLGDLNNDQRDDFAVGTPTGVRVFDGVATLAHRDNTPLDLGAGRLIASTDAVPRIAALGDATGDGLPDFLVSNGSTPRFVAGWGSGPVLSRTISLAPALSGFVAGVGDVDADGRADMLIGNSAQDAVLIHGAPNLTSATPPVAATFKSVVAAASAPYAAGADLNCDASSDLVLIPGTPDSIQSLQARVPNVPNLPVDVIKAQLATSQPGSTEPAANFVVDDDATPGRTHTSIQLAINAASPGQTVYVRPGVYSNFTVNKANLRVIGAGADQVFVNDAATFAGRIVSVTGVRISGMTFSGNPSFRLTNAGVGGSITSSLRNTIEHAVFSGFTSNAVDMDRVSTLMVQSSTLASAAGVNTPWLNVTGAPDAALNPVWSTFTPGIGAVQHGGGLHEYNGSLYQLRGNGTTELNLLNAATLASSGRAAVPEALDEGSASAISGNRIFALAPSSWRAVSGGTTGSQYPRAIAVNDNGVMVALFGNTSLQQWDPATLAWTPLVVDAGTSGGHSSPRMIGVTSSGNDFYVSGEFNSLEYPSGTNLVSGADGVAKYTPGSGWSAPSYSGNGVQRAIVDGGFLYLVSSENGSNGEIRRVPVGGGSPINVGTLYSNCDAGFANCSQSDVRVNGMVIITPYLYLGGSFKVYDPGVGGFTPAFYTNVLRINLASGFAGQAFGSGANAGANAEVFAVGGQGTDAYFGGDFTNFAGISASRIARVNAAGASAALGTGANGRVRAIDAIGNGVYVAGEFTSINGVAANRAAHLNASNGAWNALAGGVDGPVMGLATNKTLGQVYASGWFTNVNGTNSPRLGIWWLPHVHWYSIPFNTWASLTRANPVEIDIGNRRVGGVGDDAGNALFAYNNNGMRLFQMTFGGGGAWSELTPSLAISGTAPILAFHNSELYLLTGNNFYKRNDVAGAPWQALAPPPQTPTPFNADSGGGLIWDGGEYFYATQGGNGDRSARYHIANNTWEELATAPGSIYFGGQMARVGDTLFQLRGDGFSNVFKYGPVNKPLEKLISNNNLFVAPTGATNAQWISPTVPLPEFETRSTNDRAVGSAVFTPTITTSSYASANILDVTRGIYRLNSGSGVAPAGYHTPLDDVFVSPAFCATCANDGLAWNVTAFNSVQRAINSGALRVRVRPGIYIENLNLASGSTVIGSGADLTILSGTVRAEGVTSAHLTRVTVQGQFIAENGAKNTRLSRSIVRNGGVVVDGAATKLEVVNNTLVNNVTGMTALNAADVDVRNTVFANNSNAGLSYQSAAAGKLERYNLFFANGPGGFVDVRIDGVAGAATGTGDVQQDPLFVNAAVNDFRLAPGSPAVGAGSPSDPVPPATGGRVDIGYAEQAYAAVFVDDDYCAQCVNDGLLWQVDAFSTIPAALAMAASELRALDYTSALDALALRYLVGVGAGTYAGNFTLPSHITLAGIGADKVKLVSANGQPTVLIQNATGVELRGVSVDAAATQPAVRVTGNSNAITITRNVMRQSYAGMEVLQGATAVAEFNTIHGNTVGMWAGPGASGWLAARNNIISSNGTGLLESSGRIFAANNLMFNSTNFNGVQSGRGDITGLNPQFINAAAENYRLNESSPAVDRATVDYLGLPGGGERQDMGAFEVVAAPIALFLGREGTSCAVGNSGVASVDVNLSGPVASAGSSVTSTVPAIWPAATLQTPLATASYWTATRSPASEGLHRIYSRAQDRVGNIETDAYDQFEGAFYVDGTAPAVNLTNPGGTLATTAPNLLVQANVAAFLGDRTAKTVWFELTTGGATSTYAAEWDSTSFAPGASRPFRANVPLAVGTHTLVAKASDAAGNIGASAPRTLNVTAAANHIAAFTKPAQPYFNSTTIPVAGVARFNTSGPAEVRLITSGMPDVVVPFANVAANTPVPFAANVPVAGTGVRTIVARPIAGSTGFDVSINVTVDTSNPALVTAANVTVTRTAVLTGTATDAESGIERVEVSFDGGYLWMPATLSGNNWAITETLPANAEGLAFPAQARAVNRAGGSTTANIRLVLDDVAPRAFNSVRFSHEEGSFFSVGPTLAMTWTPPFDALGIARVGAVIDQNPATVPGNTVATTSTDTVLNAAGAWYAHLIAVDIAGNSVLRHYGPWYVDGANQLCSISQNIQLDGAIPTGPNEWRQDELMDDDESPELGRQALWTTWQSNALYVGWQGAALPVAGTQWFYVRAAAGGSTQPVSNSVGTLPLAATHAIEVRGPGDARAWTFNGSQWVVTGGLTATHGAGNTEARLALPVGSAAPLQMIALIESGGQIKSVFPTTNRAGLPALSAAYSWAGPCGGTPPANGQPTADSVLVSLQSTQPTAQPLGPGSTINYALVLRNLEDHSVIGGNYTVLPSGPVNPIGPISGNSTLTTTFTRVVPANLAGADRFTTTVTTAFGPATLVHRVDGDGPDVLVTPAAGNLIGAGNRLVAGTASDANSGLAMVEVSVDGGAFAPATGTGNWTAPVNVTNPTIVVSARARDAAGNIGAVHTVTLTRDDISPTVSLALPSVITPTLSRLIGTASDLPSGGIVAAVEVQINDENGPWSPAASLLPDADGFDWAFEWRLPLSDGLPNRVRVRAIDGVGNVSAPGEWQQSTVDGVPPLITVTTALLRAAAAAPALAGTATDGAGIARVDVIVYAPDGRAYEEAAVVSGSTWSWTPTVKLIPGLYSLRVRATDGNGNTTVVGPINRALFDGKTYLPAVIR